jgi:hypothetical protein
MSRRAKPSIESKNTHITPGEADVASHSRPISESMAEAGSESDAGAGAKTDAKAGLDADRVAEAAARKAYGIEHLGDSEDLIDPATFAELHHSLTLEGAGTDRPVSDEELDELLLEEVATELPPNHGDDRRRESRRAIDAAPPTTAREVASLEAQIAGATNRDDVAALALQLARRHTLAAALLVVNRGVIAGLRGEGGGLESRTEGVLISDGVGGVFSRVVDSGTTVVITYPYRGIDSRILSALGRSHVAQAIVTPVKIRGRVVNLLYADCGPDPVPVTAGAALQALCHCIARAYERLILAKKSNSA